MPELPDIELYLHALAPRVVGELLERITIVGPSVLRSVDPPVDSCDGRRVVALRRLGKRIVLGLEDELFLVVHLMIAGRLRWEERDSRGSTQALAATRASAARSASGERLGSPSRRGESRIVQWQRADRAAKGPDGCAKDGSHLRRDHRRNFCRGAIKRRQVCAIKRRIMR